MRRGDTEPDAEDQEEEQQFGREHRLYGAQLTVLQRGCDEPELDEAEPESDEPDLLPHSMADEARLEGRRLRRRLDAHTLQHRGEGVGEGGERSERDCDHVLGIRSCSGTRCPPPGRCRRMR